MNNDSIYLQMGIEIEDEDDAGFIGMTKRGDIVKSGGQVGVVAGQGLRSEAPGGEIRRPRLNNNKKK